MKSNKPLYHHASELLKIRQLKGLEFRARLKEYSQPVQKDLWDRIFVYIDLIFVFILLGQSLLGFWIQPFEILFALVLLPITLFTADVIGQVFHKALDTYAGEEHVFWGKAAQEFRKHHENPANLNHVSYINHLAAFGKLMLPMFIICLFFDWTQNPAWGANLTLLLFVLLNATEIHKQAHLQKPHPLAQVLQKLGLMINKKDHSRHHQAPFDCCYSVVNGWSQRLFDGTGFWKKMDLFFWNKFKKMPRIWIQDPRAIPATVYAELKNNPQLIPEDLIIYSDVFSHRKSNELKNLLYRD
ncbi:MAG: hypothetical protein KDD50_12040 [Bdellovibrionales bacterium]|nr:hypothetical protein [Bdellovibrionales bacterium]